MRADTFEGDGCLTTDAIAERIGVSRQRADQLLASAMMKCRVALQLVELVGWREAEVILAGLRGRRPELYCDVLRDVRERKLAC